MSQRISLQPPVLDTYVKLMMECSSLCEVQMYSLHHENFILPTKTPVLVPLTASTGTPAFSRALYVHSISNFCCGSMRSASALLMPKRRLSNELNLKYMDQKTGGWLSLILHFRVMSSLREIFVDVVLSLVPAGPLRLWKSAEQDFLCCDAVLANKF